MLRTILLALTVCTLTTGCGEKAKVDATGATKSAKKAGATVDVRDPKTATLKAPETYKVKLETSKGDVVIEITRAWAPNGADRFYNLVKAGYYSDVAFFRVIEGFMAQVGISGDPELNTVWRTAKINDDEVKQSNTRGMVTFATSGKDSRTTQFFVNFKNNGNLDRMGFAPIGKVVDMAVMDTVFKGYGEGAPRGRGPSQGKMQQEGNTYLKAEFPNLDYIKKASIIE